MTKGGVFDEEGLRVRLPAAGAVLLLHGLFWLALVHGEPGPTKAGPAGAAMRVEFIGRPVMPETPVEPRPTDTVPGASARRAGKAAGDVAAKDRAPTAGPGLADPEWVSGDSTEPLRLEWVPADGLAGDSGWTAAGESFAASGPPSPPDRFRMRKPANGKDIIEGVAQAIGLWPPGYTTDPCPKIKSNIGALMTDTRPRGREALEEELRRQRAYCP